MDVGVLGDLNWLALGDQGVRPVKISKYCVAVAVLHPWMPANPWHPAMRAFFDGRGPLYEAA
jgi:hypothetical protein